MVGEADFYAQTLRLPEAVPISVNNASVNPPLTGGLGHVGTETFFYSFVGRDEKPFTNGCGLIEFREHGKLAYIMKKEPLRAYGMNPRTIDRNLASIPSQIDTNGAYRLAKEWLAAVQVDVATLERDYQPRSIQQEYYDPPLTPAQAENPPPNAPKKKRPIFDVTWGGPDGCAPPVWVEILGPTKELMVLRMEDTRYSRRRAIVITNALALNGLPQPIIIKGREPSIGDLLRVSPAYSNVATAMMLKEANFFAEKLDLNLQRPLSMTNIKAHISSPSAYRELGYIDAKGFEFHFPEGDERPSTNEHGCVRFIEMGKLAYVNKAKPFSEYKNEDGEFDEKFFAMPSLIDTNGAYQLATQWLASVQVDVARLETEYKPLSIQAEWLQPAKSPAKGKVPIFSVTWGGPSENQPPVSVQILGTTKELIALRVEDTRFSRRLPIVIPNAAELNSKPD
jgi:hypothetical protein